MERLETMVRSPNLSTLYRITDNSLVDSFIATTMPTRRILNDGSIVGRKYLHGMQQGAAWVLAQISDQIGDQEATAVHTFLRGGLNFKLADALFQGLGYNRHATTFLSSQREEHNGEWSITQDSYRKLDVPDHTTLLIGDIVATGTTLRQGMDTLLSHYEETGKQMDKLIFFTIGGDQARLVLEEVDDRIRALNPDYKGTSLIYVEGRFTLASQDTPLLIKQPDTDLLRLPPALLAPEFALSTYHREDYALQPCVIGDGGSRAYNFAEYKEEFTEYWSALRKLAVDGFTYQQALAERWPNEGVDDRWAHIISELPSANDKEDFSKSREYLLEKHSSSEDLMKVCDKMMRRIE